MAENLLDRPTLLERAWLLRVLRQETVGGLIMLAAAIVALVWANSPAAASYVHLIHVEVGPEALHLHLSLAVWAADFLLAFFFFLAGLELKHEVAHGTLSKPSQAVVPVVSAAAGMAVPALIYAAVTWGSYPASTGWGIPMATDIAFALAVLAIMGRGLPLALRAFLLTLAVVDDLGAITVIAIFYSDVFHLAPFLAAAGCVAGWALLQRLRVTGGLAIAFVYVPLGLLTWYLTHASGVHATVAGIALGLVTRVSRDPGERTSPAERAEIGLRPFVSAFAVPVFAFTAAGVTVLDVGLPGQQGTALVDTLTSPITMAVFLGLLVGKPVGVFGGAWLMARFTRAQLNPELRWADIAVVGVLAGIGFTVSLLIAELAFEDHPLLLADGKVGVLAATLAAALLSGIALTHLRRRHARLIAAEEADADRDGIPDVYQQPAGDPGQDDAR